MRNKSGKQKKRFPDNLPGIEWFKSFMLRRLTIKLSENIKRTRALVTYEVMKYRVLDTTISTTVGSKVDRAYIKHNKNVLK